VSGYLQSVVQNRLESAGQYYPFGEQRTAPPPGAYTSFATYTRDSATGLDYADQRHYASTFSRFMTADPYQASGGPNDPQSWNRYSYVGGDPANYTDHQGLFRSAEYCISNPFTCLKEDQPVGLGPYGDESGGGGTSIAWQADRMDFPQSRILKQGAITKAMIL
jgi:RHS repeat-associated protein